ncbi:MAG: ATP-binding protein [Pseudomonadota bacterium]
MNVMDTARDVESARILDALPTAVVCLDADDAITYANIAAETLLGRSSALLRGRSLSDLVPEDSQLIDLVERARRRGGVVSGRDVELGGPSVARKSVDVTAAIEDGQVLVNMVEVRARLENDSHGESATMAEVARILGHEVKNPLAGIVGAAQLLRRKARDDQQALLTLIREEGDRIGRIVDRFAAFETFFRPRPRATNIHEVLDSVIGLTSASFGAEVKLGVQFDPSLPDIEADPDHIHEACLNLVKNAAEASIAGPRAPKVFVSTRYRLGVRFTEKEGRQARGALEISVKDNGAGVPSALSGRVFDPFFTTKSDGVGIGLAVVAEIVSAHGGFVELDNSSDGACFRLLLPIILPKDGAA